MESVISIVTHYEEYFRREMGRTLQLQSEEAIRVYKKRSELDRLFLKIYEDNANGKLSDERYAMMSATYENEQTELKAEVKKLQEEIKTQEELTTSKLAISVADVKGSESEDAIDIADLKAEISEPVKILR